MFSIDRNGIISFKKTHADRTLDSQWEQPIENGIEHFKELLKLVGQSDSCLEKRYASPVREGYIIRLRHKGWFYNEWEYCYPLGESDVREPHLLKNIEFVQALIPNGKDSLKVF